MLKKILIIFITTLILVSAGILITKSSGNDIEKAKKEISENEIIKKVGIRQMYYSGKLNISFNKGKEYKEIPIDMDFFSYATSILDASKTVNSRYLSHMKTAYALNNDKDVCILVTNDKGKTYSKTILKNAYKDYSRMYINFANDDFGYFAITYTTEYPNLQTDIYITKNGGDDFEKIDTSNDIYSKQIDMIGMLNENTILLNIYDDLKMGPIVYKSADSGNGFEQVDVSLPEKYKNQYVEPHNICYLEDNIMLTYRVKNTGEEIDFISIDKGNTFKYVK